MIDAKRCFNHLFHIWVSTLFYSSPILNAVFTVVLTVLYRGLLECGFNKVPDAVNNVLDGGQPHIVARIRKMKIDAEITPEPLKKPVLLQNPPEHMLEKEDSDDEDPNPIEEEYQEHVDEMADELEA